jgi:hypothetical protein
MDIFLTIAFGFTITLVYYGINLYLPSYKRVKSYISLVFGLIGIVGWFYVWLGSGWLLSAVVSTVFIFLSIISFSIAVILDLIMKKRPGKEVKSFK